MVRVVWTAVDHVEQAVILRAVLLVWRLSFCHAVPPARRRTSFQTCQTAVHKTGNCSGTHTLVKGRA